MSNVLPHDAQKAVRKMYISRFILAGSLVAIVCAVLGMFSLLPVYLVLHSTNQVVVPEPSSAVNTADTQHDRAEIARIQSLLTTFSSLAVATTTLSEAVATALSLRPTGVVVDHVQYVSGEITIVGSAGTRERINAYRQALQSNPHFKAVSVPLGDLTRAQGGRFTATLAGKF